jgi:hypothetical protein
MNFKIKVIYKNNTYVLLREVHEKLHISIMNIKKSCNAIKLEGMGNSLFILEREADSLNKTFDIQIIYEVGKSFIMKLHYNLWDTTGKVSLYDSDELIKHFTFVTNDVVYSSSNFKEDLNDLTMCFLMDKGISDEILDEVKRVLVLDVWSIEGKQRYYKVKKDFIEKYDGITDFQFDEIYGEKGFIKDNEKYELNWKQYVEFWNIKSEKRRNENRLKSFTPDVEDIKFYKKCYRTLALQYHPDKTNDDGEMMKFINKLKHLWNI